MAQCRDCKTIMKSGIAYQATKTSTVEWVCKKCWDDNDYGELVRKPVRISNEQSD